MDFWNFIDKNFTNIMVPLSTIGGAIIGGFITSKSQKNTITSQLEYEKNKDHEKQVSETLKNYNKVLEKHGSSYIIEENSGLLTEFILDEYSEKIRTIII
ncbi:hypothetical protein [Lysinibacillus sp. NPDC093216]|uniref:hypothetical protein n=1 Tax=Lysinibacillus sp. NPDC093216 TaxID=3390576 RepID=UPI003D032B69